MKFKDVIKNTPWETVEKHLCKAIPNSNTHRFAHRYRHVYGIMQRFEVKPNELRVFIEVLEPDGPEESDEIEVPGSNVTCRPSAEALDPEGNGMLELRTREMWFGIDYATLEDLLDTEVDQVDLQQFDPAELVAHRLRGLKFHGFEPSEIGEFFEAVQDPYLTVDASLADERGPHLLDFEDVVALKEKATTGGYENDLEPNANSTAQPCPR
jgi:hypothetical protein